MTTLKVRRRIIRLLAVCFSLEYGSRATRANRAKRDCDEKRLGRDRVCHAREEKKTADSSVIFGDIGSCQNNLIK